MVLAPPGVDYMAPRKFELGTDVNWLRTIAAV